jgi:5'-nucleotidase
VILHTADTHSQLFPYARTLSARDQDRGLGAAATLSEIGGFARLATRLREERQQAPLVLHLDSGDVFQGSLAFVQHEGEPELKALSAMGVDAQAVGNHELDEGSELFYESYAAFARFPLLGSNYRADGAGDAGTPRPFAVVDAGGLRVGVIGVGNVTSVSALRERPNDFELVALDVARSVQGYVDFLRPFADVVVAITHLGLAGDEGLVRETSGLDAVLGGHQHIVLDEARFIDDCASGAVDDGFGFSRRCSPRRVPIVHSGAYTEYLGRLTLSLDNRDFAIGPSYDPLDAHEVTAAEYVPLPLSHEVPQDPAVAALLAPYATSHFIEPRLGAIGYAPVAIPRAGVTGADSPLGNLAARAARVFAMADVSVIGASGLRRDVPAGLLDEDGLFRALPFDDAVVVVRATGAELLGALSRAAELAAQRECVTPIHVDGIRAVLDCPCAAKPCVRAAALPSGVMCARDEDCVMLGSFCDLGASATGRCLLPIAPAGSYELATTEYLARGAHGLFSARNENDWVEIAPNLARAVAERLRGSRPCVERVDGACHAGCAAALVTRAQERCAAGMSHPACESLEAACSLAFEACLALPCLDAALGAERDARLVLARATP